MPFITEGKANFTYILIVVILAVIVGGGILGYQYLSSKALVPEGWRTLKEEAKVPEVKAPEEIPEEKKGETETPEKVIEDETANWNVYTDKKFGYTIKYPEDAIIRESSPEDFVHALKIDSPDYKETKGQRGYSLDFIIIPFEVELEEYASLSLRELMLKLQLELGRYAEGSLEIISEKSITIDNREGLYATIVQSIPWDGNKVVDFTYDLIYLPFPEFLLSGWDGIFGIFLAYGLAEGEKDKYLDVAEKIYTSLKF